MIHNGLHRMEQRAYTHTAPFDSRSVAAKADRSVFVPMPAGGAVEIGGDSNGVMILLIHVSEHILEPIDNIDSLMCASYAYN